MKANKKQKILYIVTNSDLGGISKYLLEITRYLPEHIEPYYIMATSGYLSDELEKLGISKEQIFFVWLGFHLIFICLITHPHH